MNVRQQLFATRAKRAECALWFRANGRFKHVPDWRLRLFVLIGWLRLLK